MIFTNMKKQECKSLNNGKMHASNKNLKKFKNQKILFNRKK